MKKNMKVWAMLAILIMLAHSIPAFVFADDGGGDGDGDGGDGDGDGGDGDGDNPPFCIDYDGGIKPFILGNTTNEYNSKTDYCKKNRRGNLTGELIEYYCKDDKRKYKKIDCTDFGAVCIKVDEKTYPDYCACPEGQVFDEEKEVCVPKEPFCGDGKLDEGEECDDGNNEDGDGCSSTCQNEQQEIPEFTTIGAGLALAGIGAYIYRRRSRK